jgi:hypothetical protein
VLSVRSYLLRGREVGSAIGVLVENCVTCCVMKSMCGRFQLSDRHDVRLLICGPSASKLLPLAAPLTCEGPIQNMVEDSTCKQSSQDDNIALHGTPQAHDKNLVSHTLFSVSEIISHPQSH